MLVSANRDDRQTIVEYWDARFGVAAPVLGGVRLLIRGKTVWAMADLAGLEETVTSLKIEAAGLPLLRRRGRLWKPTTAAMLYLGDAITKNVVDLEAEHLECFLRGGVVPGPFSVETGYVAVRYQGKILGCALYGKVGLRSQLPRAWVEALLGGRPRRDEDEEWSRGPNAT